MLPRDSSVIIHHKIENVNILFKEFFKKIKFLLFLPNGNSLFLAITNYLLNSVNRKKLKKQCLKKVYKFCKTLFTIATA